LHALGLQSLFGDCRALMHTVHARVFDYHLAFRKYHPLDGWVDLSVRPA
jgi:hypothetical protein